MSTPVGGEPADTRDPGELVSSVVVVEGAQPLEVEAPVFESSGEVVQYTAFARERPIRRSVSASVSSSSAGVGSRLRCKASSRPRIAPAAARESCCPTT
jgi:hypothetical protein